MILTVLISCIVLGSIVGFLAGLLGIGGGLIIVPALVYLLPMVGVSSDVVMPMALGTSLGAIVITSTSAAYAHHRKSNIPWSLAKQLMILVAVGALIGAFIADSLSTEALTRFFLICCYVTCRLHVALDKSLQRKVTTCYIRISIT